MVRNSSQHASIPSWVISTICRHPPTRWVNIRRKQVATNTHDGDYKRSKLEILFTSVRQAPSPFSVISTVRIGEPLPPRDFALLIVTYPKPSSLFRWFSKLPFPSPVSALSSTELILRACASNTSIKIRVDDLRAESPSCSFSDLIVSSLTIFSKSRLLISSSFKPGTLLLEFWNGSSTRVDSGGEPCENRSPREEHVRPRARGD